MVVTDGNLTFPLAAAANSLFMLSGAPVPLIVGIGYPTGNPMGPMLLRNRDLTPATPLSQIRTAPGQPPPTAENYGGAAGFLRFIVEELRPTIAAEWPVNDARQTLFGHSLGGLFTLDAMFDHPEAFHSYVASSPSIWWAGRAVLKKGRRFAQRVVGGEITPRVLITIGGTEQDAPTKPAAGLTLAKTNQMLGRARMVDNARDLAARLTQLKGREGYEVAFQAFEAEDHMSVLSAAITRGLAFALKG